jgi:N-glycosylase/DNA lyase
VRNHLPVTFESIRATHRARSREIQARLREFETVWQEGSDERLWEELVYCIFTAGASARMGLKSIDAVRPLLKDGGREEMTQALTKAGAHRFPVARPGYIVVARNYLSEQCPRGLYERLKNFSNALERRDWLAQDRQIKGLGYKEASHFLRNIGLKGHAILDKHVLRCLADLRVIENPKPPTTRARYLATEEKLQGVARELKINFDELDLVLWSMKTGEVLK